MKKISHGIPMTKAPKGSLARIIEEAIKHIGYVEIPDNVTIFGQRMGANGKPWCGSFLNTIALDAGVSVPNVVGTVAGSESFKRLGQWHLEPKVGDFAFFDFTRDKVVNIQHVGIVVKVGLKSVWTIEGNTADKSGSQNNGGMVLVQTRRINVPESFICGYGRPRYDDHTGALPIIPPPKELS